MKKFITILLGAVAVMLLAISFVVVNNIDNEAPTISVVNPDVIYMEGSDTSVLIDAVQAIDSKGGDVSDSIKISKLYVSEDKTTVKVDFVAKDQKNNISKLQATFGFVADPNNVTDEQETKAYNIVLVNNLGIENLANSYARVLQDKGHKIVSIGLSTDPAAVETVIYVVNEGDGEDLLETFPSARIVVGNIANRVNVDSTDADVFIILGYQHSIIPTV